MRVWPGILSLCSECHQLASETPPANGNVKLAVGNPFPLRDSTAGGDMLPPINCRAFTKGGPVYISLFLICIAGLVMDVHSCTMQKGLSTVRACVRAFGTESNHGRDQRHRLGSPLEYVKELYCPYTNRRWPAYWGALTYTERRPQIESVRLPPDLLSSVGSVADDLASRVD